MQGDAFTSFGNWEVDIFGGGGSIVQPTTTERLEFKVYNGDKNGMEFDFETL